MTPPKTVSVIYRGTSGRLSLPEEGVELLRDGAPVTIRRSLYDALILDRTIRLEIVEPAEADAEDETLSDEPAPPAAIAWGPESPEPTPEGAISPRVAWEKETP